MTSFIDKTVEEALEYTRRSLISVSRENGLLQSIDPSISFLSSVALLITTVTCKDVKTLALLFLVSVSLAVLSRVPLKEYFSRVFFFIPLFTLIVALPSIFSPITPGRNLFTVWASANIYISEEGVLHALIFVFRVTVAVSFPVLLVLCLGWDSVVDGMAGIGVPAIMVEILAMTYRYAVTMMNTAIEMLLSKKSRIAGDESFLRSWKWSGELLGALFMKTNRMCSDIFMAMVSRGFSGEIKMNRKPKFRGRDAVFLLIVISLCVLVIMGETPVPSLF